MSQGNSKVNMVYPARKFVKKHEVLRQGNSKVNTAYPSLVRATSQEKNREGLVTPPYTFGVFPQGSI